MKPLKDRLSYDVKPIHQVRRSKEGNLVNRSMIGDSREFAEMEQRTYDRRLMKAKRVLTL